MQPRQGLLILLILACGAVATAYVLTAGERGAGHAPGHAVGEDHQRNGAAPPGHDDAPARGPHGGRQFSAGAFGLEVTIFEAGVPPEFRVYPTSAGVLVPAAEVALEVTLSRLGQAPQLIAFEPRADYLRGHAEIVEPHSFDVTLSARWRGQVYTFHYTQEEARVRMPAEDLARAGIEILTAGPRRIADTLRLPGEIHLNRDHLVHVVPPLAGLALSVHANAGDRVGRGQLLAVISSQTLAQLRNAHASAEARLALTRQAAAREAALWREGISPQQDYLQAAHRQRLAEIDTNSARQQLEALGLPLRFEGNPALFELRALAAGTVIDKHLAVGENVTPQTPVFSLADLSTVWAEAKVGAREIERVATGQSARVQAPSQDLAAVGKVSYVSALLGEADRAVTLRVVLPNAEQRWRPGLPVTLYIETGAAEVTVAVARSALQTLRDWQVVFGRYGELFEARPVTLGVADEAWAEVTSGLRAGERYAGRNSYLIKADIGKAGASHEH